MSGSPELTTRDVLQQVDRRLTSLDEGQRAQALVISTLRTEIQVLAAALRSEMSSQLRWIVGLILVSWVSMMGMMLPIVLRLP